MNQPTKQLQETIQSLRNQGRFKEMIEACYRLLQSATDTDNRKLQMEAYAYFALGFYKIGDVKDAFIYIEKHAMLCERYGDKEDHMNSYHIFHLLYEYTENYGKAQQVLEKSIELATELEKYNLVSENLSELSSIYSRMGNYQQALEVGKKAARIAARYEPFCPFLIIKATLAVAQAFLGMANFEVTGSLLQTVVRDPVLQDYAKEKTKCYRLLAHLQILQHQRKEALEYLAIAKESAKKSNNYKHQKEIQEVQIDLYRQLEDFQKGFVVQEQHIQLLKEIHRQESANAAMKLEMEMKLQELEKQANTDFLTGISSRRALVETANEWLSQAALSNDTIVCIAFDIDNLKGLNDTYGHPFGDQVIRHVAKVCSNQLRRSDKTGRIGGDEFVSILRDISLEDAYTKAQEMLKAVKGLSLVLEGNRIPISLSMGLAESDYGTIKEYEKLYHKADIALYRAKRNGKAQVCCYE